LLVDQSGGGGAPESVVDAQPPRKKASAPPKMIAAHLNTPQLCGTARRTQAVLRATCLRRGIQP